MIRRRYMGEGQPVLLTEEMNMSPMPHWDPSPAWDCRHQCPPAVSKCILDIQRVKVEGDGRHKEHRSCWLWSTYRVTGTGQYHVTKTNIWHDNVSFSGIAWNSERWQRR